MAADRQSGLAPQYKPVRVRRVGRLQDGRADDVAAVEEPLEVRLHGRPFAVIMRTPGEDRSLAAGFLVSEGVIAGPEDIGAVEHCRHPDFPDRHNVVDLYLVGPRAAGIDDFLSERRRVLTNSSCGLCGRLTMESLRSRLARIADGSHVDASTLAGLPFALRARQAAFEKTGGLHAAGLFEADGTCDRVAEDVGRHNAVDKVVGSMLLEERFPIHDRVLVVSGRASFEIVQKAWTGGIPIVCAVSAPSSLAVEVATDAGITLLGFVRDGGFNIYSHPHRVIGA